MQKKHKINKSLEEYYGKTSQENPLESEKDWQKVRDEELEKRGKIHKKPHTENHKKYIYYIEKGIYTISYGVAGTGKTSIACEIACKYLLDNKIKKIVLTRPIVECDEELGILPGDLLEKTAPYLMSVSEVFKESIGSKKFDECVRNGTIEICPLAVMRGRTFHNSFIIADEMQNATTKQIRMLMTRLGQNSKMVINGDIEQSDLDLNYSPLEDIIDVLRGEDGVYFVEFNEHDCLRPKIIQNIDKKIAKYIAESRRTPCGNDYRQYYPK